MLRAEDSLDFSPAALQLTQRFSEKYQKYPEISRQASRIWVFIIVGA
jgi:hypothetical protein